VNDMPDALPTRDDVRWLAEMHMAQQRDALSAVGNVETVKRDQMAQLESTLSQFPETDRDAVLTMYREEMMILAARAMSERDIESTRTRRAVLTTGRVLAAMVILLIVVVLRQIL